MAADLALPPNLAEVARRELNETPAARTECLFQLRQRLQLSKHYSEEQNIVEEDDGTKEEAVDASIPDDRFLLRFLRSKKFNVQRSYAMYGNYRRFFRDHPEIAAGLNPKAVRHVWDEGVLGGLKQRDLRGRSVIVTFPGRWDPASHALEDVLRALVLQLEYMIISEETQVKGFVLLADFTDFSFHQMRSLKPWYIQTMATLMQNSFPARFKGVYILNQPWYMNVPLSLIRPFLSEKIKRRVNLVGREMTTIESNFKQEHLPAEFGGLCGTYKGQQWSELMINSTHGIKTSLQYIISRKR